MIIEGNEILNLKKRKVTDLEVQMLTLPESESLNIFERT